MDFNVMPQNLFGIQCTCRILKRNSDYVQHVNRTSAVMISQLQVVFFFFSFRQNAVFLFYHSPCFYLLLCIPLPACHRPAPCHILSIASTTTAGNLIRVHGEWVVLMKRYKWKYALPCCYKWLFWCLHLFRTLPMTSNTSKRW